METTINEMKLISNQIPESMFLMSDNTLFKKINGEWIGKPSVQCKDLSYVWIDDLKNSIL